MLKFSRGFCLNPRLRFSRGFTLIELMVGLTIMAILLALAVPNFANWIRNAGIRTGADAIVSGLQLARTEALKKNTIMHFQLTTSVDNGCSLSTSGPHWVVSRDSAVGACGAAPVVNDHDDSGVPLPPPRIVQTYDGNQANGNKTLITAGASAFNFNGLGRLSSPAGGASILVTGLDAGDCVAANGKTRCLQIKVTPGGEIRMCDPALPSTDTQACG
jgi:type IV fimbrial biogenesis protein FimT